MKTMLLLCLLITSFLSLGKNDDPNLNALRWAPNMINPNWHNAIYLYSEKNTAKLNRVNTVTRYTVKKNGKKILSETKTYNQNGLLIHRKNNRNEYTYTFRDTLLIHSENHFKKDVFTTDYTYDTENRMTKMVYSKNGKVWDEYTFSYFEGMKLNVVEHIRKKTKTYRLETNYDELLKTPVSAVYMMNGEVKKTWNYTCDDKGASADAKEEVSSQCTYQQANADGSWSKFVRTIEQGKTYLVQTNYSKDSILQGYQRFLNDTVLISKFTISGLDRTYESYSDKGKFRSKTYTQNDMLGNQVVQKRYNRRDKIVYQSRSTYDASGLILTYQVGEQTALAFEYTFHSN